ncbi:MAG: hypothetical protein HY22_02500 [[Candidatus Thermochlorobacteriaceae] bacterium GBChlB]|nr:MAG: hypothetical protein HY22_02500 [[Candidatus Thermochlorobacteriaceae] bacterium GBChlB]
MQYRSILLMLLSLLLAQDLFAQTTAKVEISSKANIFAAGNTKLPEMHGGAGVLPVMVSLAGAKSISLENVSGKVSCAFEYYGADGGSCAGGNTDIQSFDKISGIVHHHRTMFVVGVFIGGGQSMQRTTATEVGVNEGANEKLKLPNKVDRTTEVAVGDAVTSAPERLDFTNNDNFTQLSPKLNQVFFIGDGKNNQGVVQKFIVPQGATMLFLGFADAAAFQGEPGYYDDNDGAITATVKLSK